MPELGVTAGGRPPGTELVPKQTPTSVGAFNPP